jgi:hypothetical protein
MPQYSPGTEVGLVVQLVRMPPCHGGGRGFESRPVRERNFAKTRSVSGFFIYQISPQKTALTVSNASIPVQHNAMTINGDLLA